MLECRGRVIVTGLGKSGFVARRLAATLTATGTPSLFLHPVEATHGEPGEQVGEPGERRVEAGDEQLDEGVERCEHDRLDRYGTTMAPMLLPFFTDGCIGSMEGLFFEASASTP